MPSLAPQSADTPPTPIEAVDRLVDSAQQLVVDHIELAGLEARETLRASLAGGLLGLVGAFLVALSWIGVMVWAYLMLDETLPPATRVIALAGANLAVAVGVLFAGLRTVRRTEEPAR